MSEGSHHGRKARPNVAIVGSSSPLGKELRNLLEDQAFPLGKLTLLETDEWSGLLQEFSGEITVTQILSPEQLRDVDIAFFTCGPEIMSAYVASGGGFPAATIDLTQTDRKGVLFLHGISDPRLLERQGYFIGPHPIAIVVAQVLRRLHSRFGLESSAVTVLEPASERGKPGLDELQEQTVSLLNFQQVESRVFPAQLAFNVIPDDARTELIASKVWGQMTAILGRTFPIPMIAMAQVPVFHSHAFSIFVRLPELPDVHEVVKALKCEMVATPSARGKGTALSPVATVGRDKIQASGVRRAGSSNVYSLWVVADNLRIAASNAIHIAESIVCAPPVET